MFTHHQYDVGSFSSVFHSISVSDSTPISVPSRKVPYALEAKVNKMVEEMLKFGIIRRSVSSQNSPLVVVPKKNVDLRICLDYRKLNSVTKKPVFQIPSATEIFDRLGGSSYFSTLDLSKGYYQIMLQEADREKTAFSTSMGHFEFTRMPFGLSGAPATFQRAMSTVLREEMNQICCVYLDDVIIFGKTEKEHDDRLKVVLEKLEKSGLKLSFEKCVFKKRSVSYLGHFIDYKGVRTDPKKVEKIKNWPLPKKMSDLHSFLGFAGYYRRFIRNFSAISDALDKLIERNGAKPSSKLVKWYALTIEAFEKLKSRLCSDPVLALPLPQCSFILDTDASTNSIGAVLSQSVNGIEKVIHFASNTLSPTERNYCTTRRELLAVIRYLRQFRHYLIGRHFVIRTDHKSLMWLMSWRNPSTAQYWSWIEELMEFDFEVQHRPGSKHTNADALSRLPACQQCEVLHSDPRGKRGNKEVRGISIGDELHVLKSFLKAEIPKAAMKASPYFKYLPYISIKNDHVIFNKNGLNCLVLSNNEGKRTAKKFYLNLAHCGYHCLLNTVNKLFMWPSMKQDILNVVTTCRFCLERKSPGQLHFERKGLFAEYPFQKVFTDICGPFPPSNDGYRYILAIIDGYSKWCTLVPLKTISATEVSSKILSSWIAIYGPPEKLHSDRGTCFTSEILREMCKNYGIRKTETSPYYPKGNSIVERLFKTVKDYIYCCSQSRGKHWIEVLWQVEAATRTTFNHTIGMTPFEIVFRRPPTFMFSSAKSEVIKDFEKKLIALTEKAVRKNIDIRLSPSILKIGDMVYARILPERSKSVYNPRYSGPHMVIDIKGSTLILKHCRSGKIIHRNEHQVKKTSEKSLSDRKLYYEKSSVNNSIGCNAPSEVANKLQTRYPIRQHEQPTRFMFE